MVCTPRLCLVSMELQLFHSIKNYSCQGNTTREYGDFP